MTTLEPTATRPISLARNIKIGTFHIGSSMADILVSAVWNRIAIAELGFAAFPISLLLALRYILAPLSVWIGQRSDVKAYFGYRRLPYIWGGRFMIMISLFTLALCTVAAYETNAPLAWIGMVASVILFSVGSVFSGTTYLALIYDITPKPQQTRVVSVVWFFLISGFAGSGILYSVLLKEYTREGFLRLFLIAPLIMGAFWFISTLGEERRQRKGEAAPQVEQVGPRVSFGQTIRAAWANRQTRLFFLFLGLTTMFFYTQDIILEPFGAQVFGMTTATTNRFSSYWGSMTLIAIIVTLLLARRFPARINNISASRWSVFILIAAFALFAISAFAGVRPLVTVALIVLGIGLGVWTVGTLGLMMDMTSIAGAGLYLSLWTVSETLARGAGTALGGALRDIGFALFGNINIAYGGVFLVQAVGFALTLFVLSRVSIVDFHRNMPSPRAVMEGAMD